MDQPVDNRRSFRTSLIDEIDETNVACVSEVCGLLGREGEANTTRVDTDPCLVSPRTFRRRLSYLRAAFVGDVRMSFLAVIVGACLFATGWIVAAGYYRDLVEIERQLAVQRGATESYSRLMMHISRVRETSEENEEFLRFMATMYNELERVRAEIEQEVVETHQ